MCHAYSLSDGAQAQAAGHYCHGDELLKFQRTSPGLICVGLGVILGGTEGFLGAPDREDACPPHGQ